jgi:hypothetical protein
MSLRGDRLKNNSPSRKTATVYFQTADSIAGVPVGFRNRFLQNKYLRFSAKLNLRVAFRIICGFQKTHNDGSFF